jgi:inorganic pyrophosphatase
MRADPPSLEHLPSRDAEGRWLAVVEATQGSRHKFKYEAPWRAFVLKGVLPLGLSFPYDFGFVPSTLGDDGDPLDVLVLADEALPPGAVVPCRVVGIIEAEQQDRGEAAERNDRLIAVADASHRYANCHDLDDVAGNVLDEVERFFVHFNVQKGGAFRPLGRRVAAEAVAVLEAGAKRFSAGAA